MYRAPSPSTRASVSTLIVLRVLMGLALTAERLSVGIETAKGPHQVSLGDAEMPMPPGAERRRVRGLCGAKAAVAAPVVGWTEGATPRLRYRAKTGCAARHHDAHRATPLAFEAYTMGWSMGLAPVQKGTDNLKELVFVDRTSTQFKIHAHMVRNGRGRVQRRDVRRGGIDKAHEFLHVLEIA